LIKSFVGEFLALFVLSLNVKDYSSCAISIFLEWLVRVLFILKYLTNSFVLHPKSIWMIWYDWCIFCQISPCDIKPLISPLRSFFFFFFLCFEPITKTLKIKRYFFSSLGKKKLVNYVKIGWWIKCVDEYLTHKLIKMVKRKKCKKCKKNNFFLKRATNTKELFWNYALLCSLYFYFRNTKILTIFPPLPWPYYNL